LQSELELFRWTALVESNSENMAKLPIPQKRLLVKDPAQEFESEDAANSVHQLFGFLWEYPEVFDAFSDKFLVPYCLEQMSKNHLKVDSLFDLVVHRLFSDYTGEV